MSMSINIDKVLKNTWGNYSPQKNNSTSKQANFDENIFAQASALVAEYKKEQEENNNSTSSSKKSSFGGLTFAQVAGMSTKDFLNYAYNNEAFSVDTPSATTLTPLHQAPKRPRSPGGCSNSLTQLFLRTPVFLRKI